MIAGMGTMSAEVRSNLALWAGWMAPPVAWLAQMATVYALADGACHGRGLLPLHLATAAGLVVAALGGLTSRARWHGGPTGSDDPDEVRERFMATQGVLSAWLFSALIAIQWVVVFVLDPCPL